MKREFNRRNFIKGLAAMAVVASGNALAGSPGKAASQSITLLGKRSRLRPQLSANLSLGLQVGLAQPVQVTEVRSGGSELLSVADEIVRSTRPRWLLALQQPGQANKLGSLTRNYGTSVLLVDSGANVPRTAEHDHPNIASMEQWRADYALARWSARKGARRAVILTSLYDTGYDLVAAFRAGFESAGGSVVSVLLTDDPFRPVAGTSEVLSEVRNLAPDVVHVLHSGREAEQLFQGLSAIPGPLVTANSLVLAGAVSPGVYSVSAWLEADDSLGTAFGRAVGQHPDEFGVFGYRLGQQLSVGQAVAAVPALQLFQTGTLNGQSGRRILATLPDESEGDRQLASLAAAVRTGWTTPWLAL